MKKIKFLYEKYYWQFWYLIGLIPASFWLTPRSFDKVGYILTFITFFIIAFPFALVIWTVNVFFQFMISLLYSGIKEKNVKLIFTAIFILIAILYFILGIINL